MGTLWRAASYARAGQPSDIAASIAAAISHAILLRDEPIGAPMSGSFQDAISGHSRLISAMCF